MSIVVCDLPRAGLGNQLFPLMKAAVFARLNDLPLIVVGYNQVKIGPYLRREKIKRNYRGYFTFEKGLIGQQVDRFALFRYRKCEKVEEPEIKLLHPEERKGRRFVFKDIPHWNDFFGGLIEHRDLVIMLLKQLVQPWVWQEVAVKPVPCIGVHIRMGDFRKLRSGEDFKRVGSVRTPEEYFIEVINRLRQIKGKTMPASVFTDGYKKEFKNLFSLDQVEMVENNPDIVDLLLLSKSEIIVVSANSTFSYWAGFLSNKPVILHPDHGHVPITYASSDLLNVEKDRNTDQQLPISNAEHASA